MRFFCSPAFLVDCILPVYCAAFFVYCSLYMKKKIDKTYNPMKTNLKTKDTVSSTKKERGGPISNESQKVW